MFRLWKWNSTAFNQYCPTYAKWSVDRNVWNQYCPRVIRFYTLKWFCRELPGPHMDRCRSVHGCYYSPDQVKTPHLVCIQLFCMLMTLQKHLSFIAISLLCIGCKLKTNGINTSLSSLVHVPDIQAPSSLCYTLLIKSLMLEIMHKPK